MKSQTLSLVTTDLITTYGHTASHVISACRVGGERVASFIDQRWDRALAESRSQLSADVRKNAQTAHDVLSGYCLKGLTRASDAAEALVGRAVELAGQGVRQVAANAGRFEAQTGVTTLTQIAQATLPAAVAASQIARRIEAKSGELARRIAPRAAARKPRARKAA